MFAGGEVDVIVATPARLAGRLRQIMIRLRRGGMTGLTAANVGRKLDRRIVVHALPEADDLVGDAGSDAGQFSAHVYLVDHYFEVHGVARVGVAALGRVAHHAQLC